MTEPSLPILIDSTMISCWRQCREKFRSEFILGLHPPGISIDLHAGGCFALGLEQTYLGVFRDGKSLSESLTSAHGAFMQEWGDIEPPSNPRKKAKNRDRVWEAVEHYFTLYPPESDHVRPLITSKTPSLEFTFAIPLDLSGFPLHPSGDPFVYGGRFDMLATYMDEPVVKDDKTTGHSIGDDWAEAWNLRSQFIGYTWAARQMGLPIDKVVVRGLAILLTKFVIAEAIKIYPQYLVDRWLEALRRDLHAMVAAEKEGYFQPNLADACTQYGNCIFMTRCLSANPEAWNSSFAVRHWNPLLKNPIKEAA